MVANQREYLKAYVFPYISLRKFTCQLMKMSSLTENDVWYPDVFVHCNSMILKNRRKFDDVRKRVCMKWT
jgi:hypothetical protein